MDGKLDEISELLKEHIKIDDRKHAESDKKITRLEKSKAWMAGAAAVVAIILSAGWDIITS
jgi:hypothetical protein